MLVREILECYKQSSVGESGRCSEDQNADRNTDSEDCAHEVLHRNKDSLRIR
jgi:hypothetical protein